MVVPAALVVPPEVWCRPQPWCRGLIGASRTLSTGDGCAARTCGAAAGGRATTGSRAARRAAVPAGSTAAGRTGKRGAVIRAKVRHRLVQLSSGNSPSMDAFWQMLPITTVLKFLALTASPSFAAMESGATASRPYACARTTRIMFLVGRRAVAPLAASRRSQSTEQMGRWWRSQSRKTSGPGLASSGDGPEPSGDRQGEGSPTAPRL